MIETNARLRGWQRITLSSTTTTETTAAQWDWKRRALTVPLEAFVIRRCQTYIEPLKMTKLTSFFVSLIIKSRASKHHSSLYLFGGCNFP
ncbi:hypothetical protein DDN86_18805 [Vibrio cholerae]|nr:hypothetical protein [Vibrio cholerae]